MSRWPRKMAVAGSWPIATNRPSTGRICVSPLRTWRRRTPVTDFGVLAADHLLDDVVPDHLDLRVGEQALLHHLLGPQAVRGGGPASPSRTSGPDRGLPRPRCCRRRRWPPRLPRKKKPSQVAQAETPAPEKWRSLSSPSQRAWAPVATISVSALTTSPPSSRTWNGWTDRSTLGDHVEQQLRAAMDRLLGHLLHEPGPLDDVGEARIVLDVGGDGELTARLQPLDHHRRQVRARGIDRGGQPGGTGTDDQDLDVSVRAHGAPAAAAHRRRAAPGVAGRRLSCSRPR